MRVWSRICSVLMWGFLAVSLLAQGLLILSLWMPPFMESFLNRSRVENTTNAAAMPIVAVGTLLFAAGFFLHRFCKKKRVLWLIAMLVGAVLLAGAGLYLKLQYPETITTAEVVTGYDSAFKLVWRHFTPLCTAGLAGLAHLFGHIADNRRLQKEAVAAVKESGFTPKWE